MHMHKGQLTSDGYDAQPIRDGMDEAEFCRLAKKYQYHDGFKCEDKSCLICEGLGLILGGQDCVISSEDDKRRDYALDNGVPF